MPPPLLLLVVAVVVVLSSGNSGFVSASKSPVVDQCFQCNLILQQSNNMISGRNRKDTVFGALLALCQRLPWARGGAGCQSQLKNILSGILHQTEEPRQEGPPTCQLLGLCAAANHKAPPPHVTKEAPPTSRGPAQAGFNPACTVCLIVIRKLESLLPPNVTEEALQKLMGGVCDLLPKSSRLQCNDFVDKYGAAVVRFLLSTAAPHTICSLLHLCLFDPPSAPPGIPSDCESCRTLLILRSLQGGVNASDPSDSAFLQTVCRLHPQAIPKCESFIRIHGSRLKEGLNAPGDPPNVCETAGVCSASNKLRPLATNPCSLGPTYWCRDRETAEKCGRNPVFCDQHTKKK